MPAQGRVASHDETIGKEMKQCPVRLVEEAGYSMHSLALW